RNHGESKWRSQFPPFKPSLEQLKQDLIDPEDLAEFDLHFDESRWLTSAKILQRGQVKARTKDDSNARGNSSNR
ncbi:hypothetical protein, partial [Thermosynechococcus sp.]|uniref:hypothetical protein n=1 Tax=Thermosynechococcus sp. TaxID=2814275 RepID=UPI00391BADA8